MRSQIKLGSIFGIKIGLHYSWFLDNSAAWAHSIAYITPYAAIGKVIDLNGYYFVGSLDEVRVSNIARSADWIAAEYSNQNSPSTFYTVGSAQTSGGGGGNVSITVTSPVTGMTMTVDGSNCTAPCNFSWAIGSLHTIAGPSGTGSSAWSQGYNYDGFGNLTAITGTQANSWSYDPLTNQGPYSDANGNGQSAASGGAYTYDIENRIVNTGTSNGSFHYSYAPGNKRVWRGTAYYNFSVAPPYGTNPEVAGTDEITFWSPSGQKLGTYALTEVCGSAPVYNNGQFQPVAPQFYATQTGTNYYFGGKLIKNAPGNVYSDRLGSVGQYYPYGTDRSGTPTSGEKFTGYQQDSETGLDYAVSRYQQPGSGRFLTPDRLGGKASDPGSWNRYAYAGSDPVNNADPGGQDWVYASDLGWCSTLDPSGWCYLGGGGGSCYEYAAMAYMNAAAYEQQCGDPSQWTAMPVSQGAPLQQPPNCNKIAQAIRDTIDGVGMPGGKSLLRRVVENIVGSDAGYASHDVQIQGIRQRLINLKNSWKNNNCDDPNDPPNGTNDWINDTDPALLKKYHDDYKKLTDIRGLIAAGSAAAALLASEAAALLEEIGGFLESLPAVP